MVIDGWRLNPAPASDPAASIDGVDTGSSLPGSVQDAEGRAVITLASGNPLAAGWTPPEMAGTGDLAIWTGALGEDLLEAHPHTWMGPGRDALAAAVDRLLPEVAARGGRLLLRPHARHVLSDPPSARAFLRDRPDAPLALLLEPAALFEASMLSEAAGDHLERICSGMGDLAAAVVLSDVESPADREAGVPRLVAAGTGELPAGALEAAIDRWIGPDRPRIIRMPAG